MSQKNREFFNEENSTENQSALWERLAKLEAELADNKDQISNLRQQLSQAQQQLSSSTTLPIQAVEATSRRRALKRLAAGAAGLGALSFAAQVGLPNVANAQNDAETALEATAGTSGYGGKFSSNYAQLYMPLASGAVDNTYNFGGHQRGELLVDSAGDLYFLVATTGTTANKWRKIAGPKTSGTLHLLTPPNRFVDTRTAFVLNDPLGALTNASPRTYNITALTGNQGAIIPAGAAGVVGNVTVVPSASGGFLQIGPSVPGGTDPSAINWNAGTVVANNFTAALNSSGQLIVQATLYSPANNNVNVIIDINGYYM